MKITSVSAAMKIFFSFCGNITPMMATHDISITKKIDTICESDASFKRYPLV